MGEKDLTLKLAYLYPQLLNIYGDNGNVIALNFRSQLRGIRLNVITVGLGEKINFEDIDIFFVGGGQDQQQVLVSGDLQLKKRELISALEAEAVFLAVCGGYQLLGKYYRAHDGQEIKWIDALDLYTVAGNKRMIGNVLCIELESNKKLVGFENHSGKTFLGPALKPLAKVLRGSGNNGEDGFEGIRYKNVFGTYLHGSLLPKNPHLTDKLIELALKRKGYKLPDLDLNGSFEEIAHKEAAKLKY